MTLTKLLQTTIAGSLPKPAWLAEPDQALGAVAARGRRARRGQARRRAPRAARPGAARASTSSPTASRRAATSSRRSSKQLDGVDFEHRKTVRIRNRYDADVPVVVGPVVAPRVRCSSTTRGSCAARRTRKVKVTLPGPMTMVDTLYDAHYKSREKLAWAFAEILNDEAREIEAAGVDVIQFDEPAFNVYFDEVRDWGVRTLERAAQGLALHDRRPHLLRLRHQGQHRLEEDARRRMAPVRADVPAARAPRRSTRCRSSARTRTCRSS